MFLAIQRSLVVVELMVVAGVATVTAVLVVKALQCPLLLLIHVVRGEDQSVAQVVALTLAAGARLTTLLLAAAVDLGAQGGMLHLTEGGMVVLR